jgi:hypothetical protein
MNAKYKISGDKGRKQLYFEPGDLVWLLFDRFLCTKLCIRICYD